jgi:hypothetical protein
MDARRSPALLLFLLSYFHFEISIIVHFNAHIEHK